MCALFLVMGDKVIGLCDNHVTESQLPGGIGGPGQRFDVLKLPGIVFYRPTPHVWA